MSEAIGPAAAPGVVATACMRAAGKEALCKAGWRSEGEYNTLTGNFDQQGKYLEIFKENSHGDLSTDKGRYEEDSNRLCSWNDKGVAKRFSEFSHTQNTQHAVDAWSKCVTGGGLYSAINLLPNSRRFTIEVKFSHPPRLANEPEGTFELLGYNDGEGYECKVNNEPVQHYKPVANTFTSGCQLTTAEDLDQNVGVYINTNYQGEGIGTFKVQSKSYIDLSEKVTSLSNTIQDLNDRLKAFEKNGSELAVKESNAGNVSKYMNSKFVG